MHKLKQNPILDQVSSSFFLFFFKENEIIKSTRDTQNLGPEFGAVKKHTIWCCNKPQPLILEQTVQIRHQLNTVK
jgi:hypothetical protein